MNTIIYRLTIISKMSFNRIELVLVAQIFKVKLLFWSLYLS